MNVVAALRSTDAGVDDNRAQAGHVVAIKGAAIGRKPEAGPQWGETLDDGTCYTLNSTEVHAVAAQCHGSNVGPMGSLRAGNGNEAGGVPFVAHAISAREAKGPDSDRTSGTVVAFQPKASAHQSMNSSEQSPALGTTKTPALSFTHSGYGAQVTGGATTLQATGQEGNQIQGVLGAAAIPRRLTSTECEVLQGFPKGWTAEQTDSPRYRQLGNAVTVPVAEWIGRRILDVEQEG